LSYRVDSIDADDDWLFAHAIDPLHPTEDIVHTYSSTGPFTAEINSCCRTSDEINNPDGGYRVSTEVDLSITNSSPVSTLEPIVNCAAGGLCTFVVPAVDAQADSIDFRLSTSSEADGFGSFAQPGEGTSNPLGISPEGLVSWDTTGFTLGLYSTSVRIEESRFGNIIGFGMVDFLIDLIQIVGDPPVFDVPPSPESGTVFNINPGDTVTFTIQCSDPNKEDTVTISHLGLPNGATLTPAVPSGNPAIGTFSWTPTTAEDEAVTFTCEDNNGNSAAPHSVLISVIPLPPAPEIIEFVASDGLVQSPIAQAPPGYGAGDILDIRFDQATNKPGGVGLQNRQGVDAIFTFSDEIGQDYSGLWTQSDNFKVIINTPSATPEIGDTTATVKASADLRNAAETSDVSTSTSPPLSGNFGQAGTPILTDAIFDGSDGGNNSVLSVGDTLSLIFDKSTNRPGGTGVQDDAAVNNLVTISEDLGTVSGQWIKPRVFEIKVINTVGNANPQPGSTTVTANPGGNIKDVTETSDPASNTVTTSGSLGTFEVNQAVGAGGSATATTPAGLEITVDLQLGNSGTINIRKSTPPPTPFALAPPTPFALAPTAEGDTELIGDVLDINASPGACPEESPCTFSFSGQISDLDSTNVSDLKVLHDRSVPEDGDFDDEGEVLDTTVTSDQGFFTVQADDSETSKFAIGGIRPLFLGGLSGEFAPPTFSGKAFAEGEFPLTINGAGYKLEQYSNTISTISLETGKPVQIKTLLYDPGGVATIQHLAMYMNLRGLQRDIQYSDTYIIYDKSAPTVTSDPNGFFDKVTVTPTQVGNKLELSFDVTFAKPMEKSDIIFRMWDDRRNNVDTKVFDAIVVTETEMPSTSSAEPVPTQESMQTTQQPSQTTSQNIPAWIKNNAGWWSDGQIGDSDFVSGIQYLINQGIMTIPETEAGDTTSQNIPSWIKNNAGWWKDGLISDSDFVSGIQWLVSNGIMRIG